MTDGFFYDDGGGRTGPVDLATLRRLLAEGKIQRDAPVFRAGVDTPLPAHAVVAFADPGVTVPPRPPGLLRTIGSKLSAIAGVPDIEDVPVGSLLMGGRDDVAPQGPVEDVFAVETSSTTPPLGAVPTGWPRPRVFWRVLAGALVTYLLLRVGLTEFDNPKFLPGLIIVGGFGVPLAVVVFFFEMNTPRNVSIYQVGKMLAIGGAVSLVATMVLGGLLPGSGVGALGPALLTGVVEETAKVLALLLIVSSTRFPWQLNGMLFGAAVGAGFAGFESAGYAAQSGSLFGSIMWRALLAPGGHVIWTAMIASAIWQVRGTQPFRLDMLLHRTVLHRWAVAVVLHGLWDTLLFPKAELLVDGVLLVVGWYLIFAIFKQALAEVAQAKAASAAAA